MSQRLEITEKGKILVHTDNGVFNGHVWDSKIDGDFVVDSASIGRLLASNTDNLVRVTSTHSNGWQIWKDHVVISKEDLFSAHKEEINKKDNTIEHEAETNKLLHFKMQCFNTLPFWKKMFYKFDV